MTTLTILRNRIGPIRGHHPWVFSGALERIPEGLASGDPVCLVDGQGNFLAQGYFNSYSQIAVRLWSWDAAEEVDHGFFLRRVKAALALRTSYLDLTKTNAYRLINAENDLLPGLIVDRYGDYATVQFHTAGIEAWKKEIVAALVEVIHPLGMWERSDMKTRDIENAPARTGLLYGAVPERITILENSLQFLVDVQRGQKTGFFLDQRDKRAALMKYAAGKRVMNCFSYTGGFSVYGLKAGATQVTSVDASQPALIGAEENVALNGFDTGRHEAIAADVKEYLADQPPGSFDVIVLDPPAFVKDRRKVKEGLMGYRKINELALRILPENGILVTASCSAHVSLIDFRFVLSEAAARAGRTVQILETYTHGIDHPELVAFTEGTYLKCFFVLVQ